MKGKTALKWFTLVEMIIVMVIVGILAVVLIESYLTISKTALRVEQEKNISEESLILTQIFQSIADEATIDYEVYSGKDIDLTNASGFINELYLTGGQWSWTSIYTTGNCLALDNNFIADENWNINQNIQEFSGCELILEQENKKTSITSNWKVVISEVKFKVIPYKSDNEYFSSEEWIVVNNVHQPAFWLFIHLYAPLYQPSWTNKIDQPLQLFFNLNL